MQTKNTQSELDSLRFKMRIDNAAMLAEIYREQGDDKAAAEMDAIVSTMLRSLRGGVQ